MRLLESIQEEKEEELEYLAMSEAARRAEAALEESGSVYTVGLNRKGQLGLGDRKSRDDFVVVRELRGKGIIQVSAGGATAIALSENGSVYTWGDVGTGAAPQKRQEKKKNKRKKKVAFRDDKTSIVAENGQTLPALIEDLQGEAIVGVDCGPNHAGAYSEGGDLYMWGDGTRGQLGTGKFEVAEQPKVVDALQDGKFVSRLAVGQTHTICMLENNEVLSWGFSNSGKLGLGVLERKGVEPPFCGYFPTPCVVTSLQREMIRLISCSPNHSAIVSDSGLFTWGSGDGGRLGHGDTKDRLQPCIVEALTGSVVIDISLGFWHSAAIVQVPPALSGGWLYSWGSGYHGQLAQGDLTFTDLPLLSEVAVDMRLLFIKISCGPTHCYAQSIDGDLYSWGSDSHGELARERVYEIDQGKHYTPIPGFVQGFNAMVNRVGRGAVISFSCGKNFTVVATAKYTGETEEEKLKREEEEEYFSVESEESEEEKMESGRRQTSDVYEEQNIDCEGNLCTACETCPGFVAHLLHPNRCKECSCARKLHTEPSSPSSKTNTRNKADVSIKDTSTPTADDAPLPEDDIDG